MQIECNRIEIYEKTADRTTELIIVIRNNLKREQIIHKLEKNLEFFGVVVRM